MLARRLVRLVQSGRSIGSVSRSNGNAAAPHLSNALQWSKKQVELVRAVLSPPVCHLRVDDFTGVGIVLPAVRGSDAPLEASSVKRKRKKKMNKHKQRKLRRRDRHRTKGKK